MSVNSGKIIDRIIGSSGARIEGLAPQLAITLGATAIPLGIFAAIYGSAPMIAAATITAASSIGFAISSLARRQVGNGQVRSDGLALDQLVENLRDALVQHDQTGRITLSTRSSHKLLGCEGYELTQDGLAERVHILERPLFLTAFAKAQHDGKADTIEVRLRRDNRSNSAVPEFFWAEVFFSPNKDAGDGSAPYPVTANMRDVSDAKEVRVKLEQARQAAEEASLAKNRFLAVIGHELRTPLNAIVGFSDMMANGIGGELEPTHGEYVSLIRQSGHHLLEMVNMLLDMSKIEAGGFELQAEYFEPEKLVAPCVQMVSKLASEKNVELNVTLGRHLPEMRADERACRQIMLNLLSNAVKFTDAGGQVSCAIKQRGKYVEMRVSDTGIGMDEAVMARLGEPFFQAQNNVDRGYEGTGLGMSIVKGLVDLHEGHVDVKSTPGAGTTVKILLPINGPETKLGDDGSVSSLEQAREAGRAAQTAAKELKRTA